MEGQETGIRSIYVLISKGFFEFDKPHQWFYPKTGNSLNWF